MVVTDEAVLIVDFKLGPAPARHSPAHVTQLAVYRAGLLPLFPSLPVRAALVYLDEARLREIREADLEAALDAAGEATTNRAANGASFATVK
jgi:hypothetical protein